MNFQTFKEAYGNDNYYCQQTLKEKGEGEVNRKWQNFQKKTNKFQITGNFQTNSVYSEEQ